MSQDMLGLPSGASGRILVADRKIYAASSEVTFPGLDASPGDFYVLELQKDSSVSSDWYLYVNGNTVATNYFTQYLFVNGTSVSAARTNNSNVIYSDSGSSSMAVVYCTMTSTGYFGFTSYHGRNAGGLTPQLQNYAGGSTFTIPKIFSLSVVSPTAGAIGPGSRIKLFKDF